MFDETQILTAIDSGIQTVIPSAVLASPQTVYLDFDGASASYFNRDLDIAIDNVHVEDSGFGDEDIRYIVETLNEQFDDVVFTFEVPQTDQEYSTIYIGRTDDFDLYGEFLGLAETIDSGNKIHDDNAFVFLDSTASRDTVTSVIAHEIQHIVSGMQHDGEKLRKYAYTSLGNNHFRIESGEAHCGWGYLQTGMGNTLPFPGPVMEVLSGGTVYEMQFGIRVSSSLIAHSCVYSCIVSRGGTIINCTLYGGYMSLDGAVVSNLNLWADTTWIGTEKAGSNLEWKNCEVAGILSTVNFKTSNVNLLSGGTMLVGQSCTLTGTNDIGGRIQLIHNTSTSYTLKTENARIILRQDRKKSKTDYFIDDISKINGGTYWLKVKANPEDGTYVLANAGASSFKSSISVENTNGKYMGAFKLGNTFAYDGKEYTLCKSTSDQLCLNVLTQTFDLSIPYFTITASDITTLEPVTVLFSVKNIGNSTARETQAYIYDGDSLLEKIAISAIPAGDTTTVYSYTIPAGSLPLGNHVIKVMADGYKQVNETNENNNIASATLSVSGIPDLVVDTLDVSPYRYLRPEQPLEITFKIKNVGTADAPPSTAYILDGDKLLGTVDVSSLKVGATSYAYTYKVEANTFSSGSHTIKVLADGLSSVTELRKDNNSSSTSLQVGDFIFVSPGSILNNLVINKGTSVFVYSNASANGTIVNSGGLLSLSGGRATANTINRGGALVIKNNGFANDNIICNGGYLTINEKGIANSNKVSSGGGISVISGGIAQDTIIDNGGSMTVFPSSYITNTTVKGGGKVVISAGRAAEVIVESGAMLTLGASVQLESSKVYVQGREMISSSYHVTSSVLEGTVRLGGEMTILDVDCGSENRSRYLVNAMQANIILALDERTPEDSYIINDLSLVSFSNISVSVADNQRCGIYKLAQAASDIDELIEEKYIETIKLNDATDNSLGELTIGKTFETQETDYLLNLDSSGNLLLTISRKDFIAPVIGSVSLSQEELSYAFTAIVSASDDLTATENLAYQIRYASSQEALSTATQISGLSFTLAATDAGKNMYYQVSVSDEAGNISWSDAELFAIEDVTKPTIANISANTTKPTKNNVIVTASFNDNVKVSSIQYRIGNGTWQNYSSGVAMTDNGLVYFRGMDAAGNISDLASYEVTNIDRKAPGKPVVSSTIVGTPFARAVVTASFDEDTLSGEYRIDDGNWQTYTQAFEILGNCTLYFRAVDAAGNVSEISSHVVSNIPATIISSGQILSVSSSQNINAAIVNSGGTMQVLSSGLAHSATLNAGNMYVYSGGTANNTTINSGGKLYVSSRGTANSTTINIGGRLCVSGGGTVIGTIINKGNMDISGGTAISTTISSGNMQISSGGTATSTTVANRGWIYVSRWGITNLTTVNTSGNMDVCGGTATSTTINRGLMYVSSGGMATSTIVNSGLVEVRGGTVTDTTINSGGSMYVYNGGTASNTILHSAGRMTVCSGGVLRGSTSIAGFMTVSGTVDATSATLNLALNERTTSDAYIINNIGNITGATYTITVKAGQANGIYKLAQGASAFDQVITLKNTEGTTLGTFSFDKSMVVKAGVTEYTLRKEDGNLTLAVAVQPVENLAAAADKVSWESLATGFDAELSGDGFESCLALNTGATSISTYGMPEGEFQWRVKASDGEEWTASEAFTVSHSDDSPHRYAASPDDAASVFFARAQGTWQGLYQAEHAGVGSWSGTGESVALQGRNRIADVFSGSDEASWLVLTDDANGDVLFVDDIYTAMPGTLDEQQARIAKIDEIRAGAGDDIVDMTSQDIAYTGDGVTIRGGLGNDTLWSNKGDNLLFGDAGDDRLVGASGNDVLIGGTGNDSMHGGGGNDIFAFGDFAWGQDVVQQLDSGTVELWFKGVARNELTLASDASGHAVISRGQDSSITVESVLFSDISGSWQAGNNVFGETLTLKFGDDGSTQYKDLVAANAFEPFSSENIFEKNKGRLA